MVLRKPVPQDELVPRPLTQAANNPPYPITPATEHPPDLPTSSTQQEPYSPDLNKSPAFRLQPLPGAQNKPNDEESDYSDSDWDKSDDEDTNPNGPPVQLKIGGGKPLPASSYSSALPDALRAGPPPGVPIQKPLERDATGATTASWGAVSNSSGGSIPLQTNNPYLRMQSTGQSNFGGESSQQIWGETSQQIWGDTPSQPSAQTHAQNYGELVELPSFRTPDTPTNHAADMSMNNNNYQQYPPPQQQQYQQPQQQQQPRTHSIDQPPLIAVESPTPSSAHPRHDSNASDAWNPGMDVTSLDAFSRAYGLPTEPPTQDTTTQNTAQRSWQEQQAWEQSERDRKQEELAAAQHAATQAERERQHEEEFHRAEQLAKFTPQSSPFDEEPGPALPPRAAEHDHRPPMPPRPIDTATGDPSRAGVESPTTVLNKHRKEHYQIKHIRWYDANIRSVRTSPILTQNINGPCPLLALVNALSLSTPAGVKTEFVETLRTREQVSLGYLLDAVFEELMSGRRGGAAQELPDVNALYTFLLGLHTGLNVNPVYVQDPTATDGSSTLTSGLPGRPGGFENSKDMRLYSTFNIPLFHGWLPEPGSEAYIAFDRVAKSYETAQYVQFQEEELDAKLQREGLNNDEQRLFTDIHAIKEFLDRWPTQLTDHGLRTMRDYIKPGQIAILFRNDHFTTLYKNPHTNELMTLVTDQGYSSHDEIVWESLVDVTGQGSELYSGDFRAVGNNSNPQRQQEQPSIQSMLDIDDDQGWTTVTNRRGDIRTTSSMPNTPHAAPPGSPNPEANKTEQEDHDLALALQLQEEEDDRHRRSLEERRRREDRLSEQAIAANTQGRPGNRRASRPGETPPVIPPRRNNAQQQTHRPGNEAAPPPTYEEASTVPQYHPPQGHPANPNAPLQSTGSAYQANTASLPPGQGGRRQPGRPMSIPQNLPGRLGRRHSAGVMGPNGQEEREKCIMM